MRQWTLLLCLVASTTVAVGQAKTTTRHTRKSQQAWRQEFVEKMQEIEEEKETAAQQESLQQRLFQAARRLTPQLLKELGLDKNRDRDDRGLGNNNNNNYYNYNYQNDNGNVYYYQNQAYEFNYDSEGYKDYVLYDGGYISANNLTNFALKYVGCQNIHTWDDDRVDAGLDPMRMDRFVVLRLCQADTCSAYNPYGCNADYGEYVMPMEEYLSIMSIYHFQQYNRYCQTCYDCMNYDFDATDSPTAAPTTVATSYRYRYQQNYGNNNDDDGNYFNDDYYYGGRRERERERELQEEESEDRSLYYSWYKYGYNKYRNYQKPKQLPWYVDETGTCMFQSVCNNYRKACTNYHPNATFYQDYFTCTQFQMGNKVGYLGPHCRSDGHTIGIGIFDDQYCDSYVGDVDEYSVQNSFDDQELSLFYDNSCISCRASDGYSLIKDAYVNENKYSTYPLCGAIYDNGAKCNLHMDSSSNLYASQAQTQGSVCSFIRMLMTNTYNEFGDVIVQRDFDYTNWRSAQEYINFANKASPVQILALFFAITTSVSLMVYSCYLTRKLCVRKHWQPPASITSHLYPNHADAVRSEAGRISRMNSGIVAMRSYDASSISGYGMSPRSAAGAMSPSRSAGGLSPTSRSAGGLSPTSRSAGGLSPRTASGAVSPGYAHGDRTTSYTAPGLQRPRGDTTVSGLTGSHASAYA